MLNFSKRNKGFTMLELLVVMAILGIFATLVFISLSSAREKGADAGIKKNLEAIKTQAALFYLDNKNSYLPSSPTGVYILFCPSTSNFTSGTNMFTRDPIVFKALWKAINLAKKGNETLNSVARCHNYRNSWGVAVKLKYTKESEFFPGFFSSFVWCLDSTGVSKLLEASPANAFNFSGVLPNRIVTCK